MILGELNDLINLAMMCVLSCWTMIILIILAVTYISGKNHHSLNLLKLK